MTELPPDDDPPERSPKGQGEESDTVQSVAKVNGMMVKKIVALGRYMVINEKSFKLRKGKVNGLDEDNQNNQNLCENLNLVPIWR